MFFKKQPLLYNMINDIYFEIFNIESLIESDEKYINEFLKLVNSFNMLINNGKRLDVNEIKNIAKEQKVDMKNLLIFKDREFMDKYIYLYKGFPIAFPIGGGIDKSFLLIKNICNKIDKYIKGDECLDYIFTFIYKPLKIFWFNLMYDELHADKYEVFQDMYSSLEYGFSGISKNIIEECFKLNEEDKNMLIEKFADKDGYIIIYRGEGKLSTNVEEAYSWTVNENIAKWFAKRFDNEDEINYIYRAEVHIDNIRFYYDREEEVIVTYDDLVELEKIEI